MCGSAFSYLFIPKLTLSMFLPIPRKCMLDTYLVKITEHGIFSFVSNWGTIFWHADFESASKRSTFLMYVFF